MKKYTKRADGRYLAQIKIGVGENGKPKYKNLYAYTQAELEEKIVAFKSDFNKGRILDDKNLTIAKWAEIWLDTYKNNITFTTRRRYESIIKNQINPHIGHIRLSKLRFVDVQQLINELSTAYSYSTVKKAKETINQIFAQAIRNGYAYNNPTDGIQMSKATYQERTPLTEREISKLCFFCKNYRHGAFIMTLLYSGLRRGEILALTWNDLDFIGKKITVSKAVEFRNNQPFLKEPKSKKGFRTVPLLAVLETYLKELKKHTLSDTVFVNAHGHPHTESSIRRLWEDFLRSYNRFLGFDYIQEHITMHQFRHTYATLLYHSGVDVKTAQEFLGHSSINITLDVYTHLDEKIKQQGADKLNQFLSHLA